MNMEGSYLLLALIGVIAGFVNVLAGGGSLLTLPIMNLYMGMPGPLANGTNRVAILAGAINAVIAFFKKGVSDLRLSLTLSLCALPGALAGALIGCKLEGIWFRRVLAAVMVCILILMSVKKRAARAADQSGPVTTRTRRVLGHVLMVGAGFYGGFIQAGVGLILMPILHKVMGLDLVRVNLHKSFVVAVFTVVALAVYAAHGRVAWVPGIWLACGNSTGAWIGTHFAVKKGDRLIRIVFDLAVIALVIKLLLSR